MKILVVVTGEYGKRHLKNIREYGPKSWEIETWQAPPVFPPFIDDPEDFLPDQLPAADLILSFAEHKGAAELLPDIAKMVKAKAVLVAVDDELWLPRGLDRQLHGWLEEAGVDCVTPKPMTIPLLLNLRGILANPNYHWKLTRNPGQLPQPKWFVTLFVAVRDIRQKA